MIITTILSRGTNENINNTEVDKIDVNYYALTTKVIEINREKDEVVCEDYNGNLWVFTGCEDWMKNDTASLLMCDNGTDIIYDDSIINMRYSAWDLSK